MPVILPTPVTISLTDLSGNALPSEYFGGELHYFFTDNPIARITKAKIKNTNKTFILWSGHEYDIAGNYTQQDVEDKISSFLSGDAAGFISSLYTGVYASGTNDIILN
jgi:hypothetical protein